MPRYALLLTHPADRYTSIPTEEYKDIMGDYFAWVQDKLSNGVYQGGHKLVAHEGKQLSRQAGGGADALQIHDIASTEVAEVLGGVMIIEADSLDTAIALVSDHPHFVHNTNMAVVPIDPASEN